MGLVPRESGFGMGWDGMLLSVEGNPLGYTLPLALASPREPLRGQT